MCGAPVNLAFLRRLAEHPAFEAAGAQDLTTAFIAQHRWAARGSGTLGSQGSRVVGS